MITGELLDAMMGKAAQDAHCRFMIDRHGLVDDTIERLAAESMEVFAGLLEGRLAPMPGLVELLAALEKAKIPKAVATSSTRAFTDDVLGRFDFHPRFKFILTSRDVVHGKPHPGNLSHRRTAAGRFAERSVGAGRQPQRLHRRRRRRHVRRRCPRRPEQRPRLLNGLAGHQLAGGPAAVSGR